MDLITPKAWSERDLILPGVHPDNLQMDGRLREIDITGDVYRICDRVKEHFGDLIFIRCIEDVYHGGIAYMVMENTPTGQQVVYVTKELDARVIENIQYLLKVPFEQRIKEVEAWMDREIEDEKDDEFEEIYERLGGPMLRQLEHDGFIETRNKSYPKLGVAVPGRAR